MYRKAIEKKSDIILRNAIDDWKNAIEKLNNYSYAKKRDAEYEKNTKP
ncbi:hypothetical protein NIES267_35720 [Calothrix parasitica NIES-267]|uniref:Uncharacterized protein n=1 Tax=Calothrix parasitica NIES-267 TaxID=1973488 RepID=A0A1Z4LS55_9CYAN|nr:hypothetical protein NIES267_35720 [Calothrix parasitica NIES-267]